MELEVLPARLWAGTVAGRLVARLAERPALRLCLPTGATPVPVYAEVAERVAGGEAGLARAEVFGLDEFGLPPGHPARCDALLRRTLLDRLPAPPRAFDRLDPGAPDLDAECARFQAAVDRGGLDLVLLGLGRNGHVGLNEPGAAVDSPTRRVTLAPDTVAAATRYGDGEPAPAWGLTLGLEAIMNAGEVWLLVTGAEKAGVLARVLSGPIGTDLPASFLRDHPAARVIADEPAVAAL